MSIVGVEKRKVFRKILASFNANFLGKKKINRIIPIEVKSGKSVNNTSLTRYNDKFNNDISVRYSLNNFKLDGKIFNIPLYFIEYMYKFI